MKTQGIGIVLLAMLLAGMTMVQYASALEQTENNKISNEIAAIIVDSGSVQLPQLQFNKTQSNIVLNNELVLDDKAKSDQIIEIAASQTPEISGIPFGAIVNHSPNGITTVFDSNGKQLFSVEDSKSAMVDTPNGPLPAAHVFEVPDKSLIVENEKIINVFYQKNRILSIIRNSMVEKESAISQRQVLDRWIEYGETSPISTVGQFSARWNVPKSPMLVHEYTRPYGMDGTLSTIWNGLESSDGNYLLQPVLEWYVRDRGSAPYPEIANWSIATWWAPPGNGIHSTRMYGVPSTGELILRGDEIEGNIMHSGAIWLGATTDLTLGISSTLFLDTTQSSNLSYRNLRAFTVLEGWNPYLLNPQNYDYRYIPGNVTFRDIIIDDIYGINAIPASIIGIVNSATWDTTDYRLSVTNSTWPTRIRLHTGNN